MINPLEINGMTVMQSAKTYFDKETGRKQYTVRVQESAIIDTIERHIGEGASLITYIPYEKGRDKCYLIIFEKNC